MDIGTPEENKKIICERWYYSSNKLYGEEKGRFWFMGRDDDVIRSSGYRIGPFEVESALVEHPDEQEAAVVGSPDHIRGVFVKAFVVLNKGFLSLRIADQGYQNVCEMNHRTVQIFPRN